MDAEFRWWKILRLTLFSLKRLRKKDSAFGGDLSLVLNIL
jgi:hypothetical protein